MGVPFCISKMQSPPAKDHCQDTDDQDLVSHITEYTTVVEVLDALIFDLQTAVWPTLIPTCQKSRLVNHSSKLDGTPSTRRQPDLGLTAARHF